MVEIITKNRWKLFALVGTVWLLTNIISVLGGFHLRGNSTPVPYGEVDIIRAEFQTPEASNFEFVANFIKYECDPESLRVAVKYPGFGVIDVPWVDMDGREDDERVGLESRLAGEQTLRITWEMKPDYEWVEIRLSHLCPTRTSPERTRVPTVFARLTGSSLIPLIAD